MGVKHKLRTAWDLLSEEGGNWKGYDLKVQSNFWLITFLEIPLIPVKNRFGVMNSSC